MRTPSIVLASCFLALAACQRHDAAPGVDAAASQPIDRTRSTAEDRPLGPAAPPAAPASATVSSRTTGTSPMPTEVTRPPEGSPHGRGGMGPR